MIFFVKDVCDLQANSKIMFTEKKKNFFVDFFNFKTVLKTIKMTFKHDGNNRRKKILVLLLLEFLVMGPNSGKIILCGIINS